METGAIELFVAHNGDDRWSGTLPNRDAGGNDGPLATVERARDLLREAAAAGRLNHPVTVWLRGGRYMLTEPLVFMPEHSGPITYAAYGPADAPEVPILDGGRRIEGWRVEEIDGVVRWNVDLPQVAEGTWYFHQLWVNGQRRPRARLPKQGFYWMEDVFPAGVDGGSSGDFFNGASAFRSAPGNIQPWRNIEDVEVVAVHYWVEERMPIVAFNEATREVQCSHQSVFLLNDDVTGRHAKYYVENVSEALSEPGEWYLDRVAGTLSYLPLPGEEPATTDVFAPWLEAILRLEGQPDQDQLVEALCFEGIHFEHADWRRSDGGGPLFDEAEVPQLPDVRWAAAPQAASNVPGAIQFEGVRDCSVVGCVIAHIGGYGIELGDGCQRNRIVGNALTDLGGGGIKIGGTNAHGPRTRRTGGNRVTDNEIWSGGHVFPSAVGILLTHAFGNLIAHNRIYDLFYTGISSGWIWDYGENVSRDNRIEHNDIHHLGHGLLSDMGGIYILGTQPGTVVRGNLVHDIEKCNYGGWGIYLDAGSAFVVVEQNICYNLSSQGFHQNYGRENIVRNNIFAFGREGQAAFGRGGAPTLEHDHMTNAVTFVRNILIGDDQPGLVGGNGGPLETPRILSDLNIFWDISGRPPRNSNVRYDTDMRWFELRSFTLAETAALGYDWHSLHVNPHCRDLGHFDFTLDDDSPALTQGFRPFSVANVGPRPRGQWDE